MGTRIFRILQGYEQGNKMKYSNMTRRFLSHRLLSLTIEPRQLSRRYKADLKADLKNRNLTFESLVQAP